MGNISLPDDLQEYFFHEIFMILCRGLIPGEKENDRVWRVVCSILLNTFDSNPDEEKPHNDYITTQNVRCQAYLQHNQDVVYWI